MKKVLLVLLLTSTVCAQALRKQTTDKSSVLPLAASERAELGDPLFRLVLDTHPTEARLDEIVRLLKGTSAREQFFVVDERIVDSSKTPKQERRAVVGFTGTTQTINLKPNVMLSVIFDQNAITPGFIEAWGWDDTRGRYNYYKLDGMPPTWKFRGSSVGADALTDAARADTCFRCHVNGGPVMKELPFPWNNWHSDKAPRTYLRVTDPGHWPIAESTHLSSLERAETLETDFILPAIKLFSRRRIEQLTRPGTPAGFQEVTDGRRLLRSLFETTEYNIISSGNLSGMHPIPTPGTGPTAPIVVPDTFFLNSNFIAGNNGATQYQGLNIAEARQFATLLKVSPAEYRKLVTDAGLKLGGKPGDNNFAWFVPEPSHTDNQLIDEMVKKGVITPQFAAAVLALDVETPVFSTRTKGLLKFVPTTFKFKPRATGGPAAAHPDALTQQVITNLKAVSPAAGSVEADFLALLQNADPVNVLRQRVKTYLDTEKTKLAPGTQREAELKRLFTLMVERRKTATKHPILKNLQESDLLFALKP